MKREEAKRRMEFCRDFLANNYSDMGEPNFTAFNMAISALEQNEKAAEWYKLFVEKLDEQEPCDAISREQVLNAIADYVTFEEYISEDHVTFTPLIKKINMMPSVTPKPTEDAISIRKDALKTRVGNIVAYNVEWLKKHWQMEMDIVCGVKPCEDAISRAEVLKGAEVLRDDNKTGYKAVRTKYIRELPSVTPIRYKGHWQEKDIAKDRFVFDWYCDKCGCGSDLRTSFCPNCGAKMVEPQESEDKE